ncbi:RepA family replication protein [Klebsiella pneumoniae]|uniref:RepA family replication protein n=1 Tax=Klebsiella pneumoniae TaxID=573 RepID=UPI0038900240
MTRWPTHVQCSITTLAIECGLATESAAGKLSITRATRALTFLSELGRLPTRRNMTRLSVLHSDRYHVHICTVCCPRCIRGGSGRRLRLSPCGMGKQTTQKAGAGYHGHG